MKNLFIFFLLVIVQQIAVANPTRSFTMPRLVYVDEVSCSLPPPSSLNVNAIGPDWVNVSWPSVAGAAQYMLLAYDGVGGASVGFPLFVPGTATSATVSTAGNSGSAFVRIWSVCSDGSFNHDNFTQSEVFDTIIVDLIAGGYSLPLNYKPSQPVGVGFANGQEISWNGAESSMRVSFMYNGVQFTRDFGLVVSNGGSGNGLDVLQVLKGTGGESEQYLTFLTHDFNNQGQPIDFIVKFRSNLNMEGVTIGEFSGGYVIAANGAGVGKIYKENAGNPGCVMIRKFPTLMASPPDQTGNEVAERNSNFSTENEHLSVQPNPFNNQLTIKLPAIANESETTVHLYDLLGSVNRSYRATADQAELTFNTADLHAGVYFLRVESGGTMKTIKVVKTQ